MTTHTMTTHHTQGHTPMTDHDCDHDHDDHGLMTVINTTIATIATATETFANTRVIVTQLRWHGHTYLAPLGTKPPNDNDDEPDGDWVRVEPD